MPILYSLIWEKDKWSWGNIVKFLLKELEEDFKIISIDYDKLRKGNLKGNDKMQINKNEAYFLSQGIGQLQKLEDYDFSRVICRLGGLRVFQSGSIVKNFQYLRNLSKCFGITATNEKLKIIAELVHNNVYFIPNGLDLEEWKYMEKWKGIESKKLIIGFAGNIKTKQKRDYKGFDIIEDVCSNLNLKLKTALFGREQIPHEEMQKKFYKDIDILILLTDGEGCSNTIMECLACGVPVITTREAGFHGEKLFHEINVLFSQKNRKSLKEEIQKLIRRPALYKRISENGRIFAEENHDIKIIAQKYKEIFEKCADSLNKKRIRKRVSKSRKTTKRKNISIENKGKNISDTTIACILNKDSKFDMKYVLKLNSMLHRYTTYPFKFTCLLDEIYEGLEIKGIKFLPKVNYLSSRWSKIELFRSGFFNTERAVYLDLDIVIRRNIDDILLYLNDDFYGLLPWNLTNQLVGVMSTGIMAWKVNKFQYIYNEFTEEDQDNYPDDQLYISDKVKNKYEYIPIQDVIPGIYSFKKSCRKRLPSNGRIICFHGKPLLHKCNYKWIKESWII